MLQILDAPVPQTLEQLPDIRRFFNTLMPDPEQVIEEPKILPEDVSMRRVVREPQLAEQLVDVPTNPGYTLAVVAVQTLGWRTAAALIEQFGDAPAPGRGGGGDRGRFSRFSPGEGHRQARAEKKYWPGLMWASPRSCSSCPSSPSRSSPRSSSLDRVLDIRVVDAVVYDSCRSRFQKWKCLRFSHRQSSMTIWRRVWPIFRILLRGVESRGARIFSSPRR